MEKIGIGLRHIAKVPVTLQRTSHFTKETARAYDEKTGWRMKGANHICNVSGQFDGDEQAQVEGPKHDNEFTANFLTESL